MAGLLLPVGPRRMSSWAAHQRRSPKSTEPGTDFYCPIGTPVYAPGDGVIYGSGDSITPATGRWVGVDLDNGQRFRCMHLNRLVKTSGRVRRGELIGISGASGYGKPDWSADPNTGGAHTHVTLWPTHRTRFGYDASGKPYTIDFMQYADLGSGAGGGGEPLPLPSQQEDDMATLITGGGQSLVVGPHLIGFGSPADVQAVKGATVLEVSPATHYNIIQAFQRATASALPVIVYSDGGDGTIYILEAGDLTALADIKTVQLLQSQGAASITLSEAEVQNLVKQSG